MSTALSHHTLCLECGSVNRVAEDKQASAAICGRCASPLCLDQACELDDARLSRLLAASDGLVLLDVWAPWCGPCRAMAPNFAAAARALAGQARLVKLNADTSQTVNHLGVSGIPTLILFRNGRIIDRRSGLMSADMLTRWVRGHTDTAAVA